MFFLGKIPSALLAHQPHFHWNLFSLNNAFTVSKKFISLNIVSFILL